MSTALAVYHGGFGRASVYRIDRPLATHAHREGHLLFYLRGHAAGMMIGDRHCPVGPLGAAAVNPWQPHCFLPGADEVLVLILYVNPNWFLESGSAARRALRFGTPAIEVTAAIDREVERIASALLDGRRSAQFDSSLHALTSACFDQSWACATIADTIFADGIFLRDYRVRKSMQLMRDRIGDDVVIADIARDAGMSRPHFYKLFRRHVGLTPNLYLNTLRMETAIERLTRSDEAVTNIGLDLGFASQTSFTRFFISNVGIAPTNYRRVVQMAA